MNKSRRILHWNLILTFIIGLSGGWLAWLLGLPIPWLLGSLCSTVLAARLNIPIAPISRSGSRWLRVVIGVSLGSFVAASLDQYDTRYTVAVILALLFTLLVTVLGSHFFRKWFHFESEESFIASLPGGLSYLMAIASDLGPAFPRIGLVHTVRIVVLVFVFSALAFVLGANGPEQSLTQVLQFKLSPEILGLLLIITITGWVADRSRISGGHVIFGMIFSALAYKFGLLSSPVPELLITLSMVLLGVLLGVELIRGTHNNYLPIMLASTIFTLCAMGLATLMALPASHFFEGEYLLFLLALAPGGIAEISLIALALGLDVGLVAIAHASRFIFIIFLGPIGLKYVARS